MNTPSTEDLLLAPIASLFPLSILLIQAGVNPFSWQIVAAGTGLFVLAVATVWLRTLVKNKKYGTGK